MAKKRYGKNVIITETGDIDKTLQKLPKEIAQGDALGRGLNKAGKAVIKNAKPRVPRGDPTHKPEKIALYRTLKVIRRIYREGTLQMAVVGPTWPDGAHGHLVEEGHKVIPRGKVGASNKARKGHRQKKDLVSGSPWVPGKEFMAPAVTATKQQQETEIIESIRKEIIKHGG
jgi:hypothetical protein